MRLLNEWGVSLAAREMIDTYGLAVLHGPFRGMKYPRDSILSRNGIPILFGTYELELHPVIEEVSAKCYDSIVDIGSAEGYYAVGLALRTKTLVHAFDCEPRERHYLRQMARINGVPSLVRTRSWCDASRLARIVNLSRSLVISDCEGFEISIFTDHTVPALRNSDLIIELHENLPGTNVHETLVERFDSTHLTRVIAFDSSNYSLSVPNKWRRFAREFRPAGQQWLYLTPKQLT